VSALLVLSTLAWPWLLGAGLLRALGIGPRTDRLAWGGWVDVERVRRHPPAIGGITAEGITGVKRSHMGVAARLGLVIKLVARAERSGDHLRGAVTPMAVRAGSRLGATGGVTNHVEFECDPAGRVSMAGPGAGGPATSSAILADLLALAGGAASTWGLLPPADPGDQVPLAGGVSGHGSAGFLKLADLALEVAQVLEVEEDRGEAEIGHGVQFLELVQDMLPDLLGGELPAG